MTAKLPVSHSEDVELTETSLSSSFIIVSSEGTDLAMTTLLNVAKVAEREFSVLVLFLTIFQATTSKKKRRQITVAAYHLFDQVQTMTSDK